MRDKLRDSTAAQAIARFQAAVATADTIQAIRLLESQAGAAYWSAWHNLPIGTIQRADLMPSATCTFDFL